MKKYLFCLFLIGFALNSFAQNKTDSTQSKGTIKFYPLQLIVGEARFGFEKPIKKHWSLDLNAGYLYGIIGGEIDGDLGPEGKFEMNRAHGFAVRGGVKLYVSSERDHSGFYFEPLLLGKYVNIYHKFTSYPPLTENIFVGSFQGLFGYTMKVKNKIQFDIYSGIGLKSVFEKYNFNDPNKSFNTGTNIAQYYTVQLGFSLNYKL